MSTIKITNLTSSGAIVGNVVLPVVGNVAGTLTTLKATVDQLKTFITASAEANILAANAATIFANTNMKLYVDGQVTAANAGVTAANLGMKGYVDSVANQSIYGNANVASYLIVESYAKITDVTTANTIMKNYVDGQIIASNVGVTSANLGMKGYVDSGIAGANIGMLGYVDSRIIVANAGVTSANLGMKGYVDNAVTTLGGYSNVQAEAFFITNLPLYEGNIGVNVNVTNGIITADSFVGDGSLITGLVYTAGNIIANYANISGDSVTGQNALLVGVPGYIPFGNAIATFHGNINSPMLLNIHNKNIGNNSTAGVVITADIGDPYNISAILGMASSNYTTLQPLIQPSDGFLQITGGGNLVMGAERSVVFYTDNLYETVRIIADGPSGITGNVRLASNVSLKFVDANSSVYFGDGTVQNTAYTGSYTMGNSAHWTSNVTTVSAALDQLAQRIYNIENP